MLCVCMCIYIYIYIYMYTFGPRDAVTSSRQLEHSIDHRNVLFLRRCNYPCLVQRPPLSSHFQKSLE